ncbi:Bug family tripartite tricarboxylate transporter substrate binding protein [Ornithinimicrobium tianjinense]|uniref:Tricarboxylate transporter n=1 Tax=Ornithinimicrobium tianjinense TaxID=1195761 RepID=A0A917F3Y6_9MICO|nr:tripartite tricarboxylate transporter substrate-binding protein [Ornithinimicrobium tianjinense]GGF40304.1 tricarboxylate transporter [Ornithinimicrobium tianjinense]
MRSKVIAGLGSVALLAALTACGNSDGDGGGGGGESAADYPTEDMDWTIAFGPGGGNDIMARTMVEIIKQYELYPEDIRLENREGGSGATGWGYLLNQRGSGYGISTTSGSFITTPLQADTGWTYKDFTPVGLFATDDALFVVPGDSEFQTWEDWVEHATAQESVVVGGISTVNVDFILHSLIADAAGYEIEYVPFNEEGQLQTALFSGSLDAIVSNTGSILGQVEAEEVRPLLYTGKEALPALPDIPTGEDKGIEDLPAMPRGMILPPEAPAEAQEWWINTMKEVVETPEWDEYIESNYLTENVLWGEDFMEFLDATNEDFRTTLEEAGAL